MKKTIVIAIAVFFLALTAIAQQPGQGQRGGTPEERAKRQTEWMKAELQLTDAQMAKVDSIYLASEKEMEVLRGKEYPDRQARMEAMRPVREKRTEELKKVFTEEQYKKVEERMQQFRRPGGGGGGQP